MDIMEKELICSLSDRFSKQIATYSKQSMWNANT